MPRLRANQNPSYRLHSQSGQAVVTLNGKDVLLGKHDTPESRQEYDRQIAKWLANGRQRADAVADLTIAELVARFWSFAERKYRTADGKPKEELRNYRHALTPLLKFYSRYAAGKFGAADLRAVQGQMITDGLWPNVVNRRLGRVRYVFRWGVSSATCRPRSWPSLRRSMDCATATRR
jgi:hypothetical protein